MQIVLKDRIYQRKKQKNYYIKVKVRYFKRACFKACSFNVYKNYFLKATKHCCKNTFVLRFVKNEH